MSRVNNNSLFDPDNISIDRIATTKVSTKSPHKKLLSIVFEEKSIKKLANDKNISIKYKLNNKNKIIKESQLF